MNDASGIDKLIEPMLPAVGYACDVGACDGLFASNTKRFEDKGWTVLCLEPNPMLTKVGQKNRKLFWPVACGSQNLDDVDFVICGEEPWAAGSGFHSETAEAMKLKRQTVSVRLRTLDVLLAAAKFPRLDLLSIDTEWHDLEVLKGISLDVWRPHIIVVEALSAERKEETLIYLSEHGYQWLTTRMYDMCFRRRAK